MKGLPFAAVAARSGPGGAVEQCPVGTHSREKRILAPDSPIIAVLALTALPLLLSCNRPRSHRYLRAIGGEFELWEVYVGGAPLGTFGPLWEKAVRRKSGEWVSLRAHFDPFYYEGYCFWTGSVFPEEGADPHTYWFAARNGESGYRWFRKEDPEKMAFLGTSWSEEKQRFTGPPDVTWEEFKLMYEREALRCRPCILGHPYRVVPDVIFEDEEW